MPSQKQKRRPKWENNKGPEIWGKSPKFGPSQVIPFYYLHEGKWKWGGWGDLHARRRWEVLESQALIISKTRAAIIKEWNEHGQRNSPKINRQRDIAGSSQQPAASWGGANHKKTRRWGKNEMTMRQWLLLLPGRGFGDFQILSVCYFSTMAGTMNENMPGRSALLLPSPGK